MVSPLACQVGSCFVWPCCFPRLVLFGLVPCPPVEWGLWSFGWPRPACGGQGISIPLLPPLVSSNVIVTCLVPSPLVGWGLWSFWLAPPRLCGAVCSTEIWYLLAVMSSLRARYHTKHDFALFSLQTVPLSLLSCGFSAPVKKHRLGSFSIVLPPSGLRGFVLVVQDCWKQPGGRGPAGGGGVGARDSRAEHILCDVCMFMRCSS